MTDLERPRFVAAMARLVAAYSEPMNDERMAIYAEHLADVGIAAIEKAVRLAIERCKWFPKIAELRALAFEAGPAPTRGPSQRRLNFTPHTASGREAAALLAQIASGQLRGEQRLAALRDMAAKYPNAGWDEVIAETVARESVSTARDAIDVRLDALDGASPRSPAELEQRQARLREQAQQLRRQGV